MDIKSKHVDVRLTPREANALEALAKRAGVSKSEYLRRYVYREAKKSRIPI